MKDLIEDLIKTWQKELDELELHRRKLLHSDENIEVEYGETVGRIITIKEHIRAMERVMKKAEIINKFN